MDEGLNQDSRTAKGALAVLCTLVTIAGCAAREPKLEDSVYAARSAQYRRLAIVCTPDPAADPGHCPAIMDEAARMAPSRLDFLETADLLRNAAVDASTRPPMVQLENAAAYDGIVALVYSTAKPVVLDIYLLDARTGAQVWHHQLSTDDGDIPGRLRRHGYWTPTTLKRFYRR